MLADFAVRHDVLSMVKQDSSLNVEQTTFLYTPCNCLVITYVVF